MQLIQKKIIFGITNVLSMLEATVKQIEVLVNQGANIIPVMSTSCCKEKEFRDYINKIERITEKEMVNRIEDINNIANDNEIDIMIIAPCSGNTLGKLANSISDTVVLNTAKYHLKYGKPLVLGIHANDGLSGNAENIGKLLNQKQIFFVPFRQPNPITKPYLLSFDSKYILNTILKGLEGEQIQPILL